jgi:hypothetical protein
MNVLKSIGSGLAENDLLDLSIYKFVYKGNTDF